MVVQAIVTCWLAGNQKPLQQTKHKHPQNAPNTNVHSSLFFPGTGAVRVRVSLQAKGKGKGKG